ncbi:MAG TPA: type II secretion system F family protein [Patescibacteria group bacterium]|nr:type II secretion system F family protein [Patescibacteria group bacterium]
MPVYKYKAKDNSKNKIIRNNIVAFNETEAIQKLAKKDWRVLKMQNISDNFEGKLLLYINKIKQKDLVMFFRQFAVMIEANVTIVESLKTLVDQTKNISLQKLISELAYDVDSGYLLSDAMAKRPDVFSEFYINIIRSGETSGKLEEVLNYLADEVEKNYDMVSKIKNAMIYPIFIISALIGVGIFMMVFILPELISVIAESGGELPVSTRIVIAVSNFLQSYLWLVIILAVGAVFGFKYIAKTKKGGAILDKMRISLPVFGNLFRLIYIVRFTRSLGTLLKGGVNISKSLEISGRVVKNQVYKRLINDTLKAVNDGSSIVSAFEKSSDMPVMVTQMMAIGEKAGKLDDVLDRITEFYNKEINSTLDNLTTILEPLIMVILAVGVGIMVAAVILPMYNLASSF